MSRFFGHDRYGPQRARVSRLERKAQKRVEAEQVRVRSELAAARAEQEHRQVEAERQMRRRCAAMEDEARRRGWQAHAQPYADLRKGYDLLKRDYGAEQARRRDAEAEAADLRARLAAIEAETAVMALR